MFKRMLTGALVAMTIAAAPVFAQTWVETDDDGYIAIEYTVITEEQFNRLLRQFEAGKPYAAFSFEDVLLKKPGPGNIVSGRMPVFNGYYYLLEKITVDRGKITADESMYADMAEGEYLVYGHKDTGKLTISFPDIFTAMLTKAFSPDSIAEMNSAEYKQKIERFFGFVKEK